MIPLVVSGILRTGQKRAFASSYLLCVTLAACSDGQVTTRHGGPPAAQGGSEGDAGPGADGAIIGTPGADAGQGSMPDPGCVSDAALVPGANLAGADLRCLVLANRDLSGADLTGANLSGMWISDVDLSNADLSRAKLAKAELRNVKLRDAELVAANLREANLDTVDLTRADLGDADFTNSTVRGGSLVGATLTGARLAGSTFNPDFTGAKLVGLASCPAQTAALCVEAADGSDALVAPGVDLGGIDLTTAKLAGVNGVNLVACPAVLPEGWLCVAGSDGSCLMGPGARLSGAKLQKADLRRLDLHEVVFDGADLTGADLTGADLTNASFLFDNEGGGLSGTRAVDLAGCPGPGHVPSNAHTVVEPTCVAEADGAGSLLLFPGGRLDHVDLHGVDLSNVDLSRADLSYANLAGASLASAKLDSTNLAHADLTGTELSDAWFQGVRAWGLAGCPATPPGYTSKDNVAEWVCVETPAGGFALIGGAADLSGADLSGADLSKVEAHELRACPEVLPTKAWQCVAEPHFADVHFPDAPSLFAMLGPGAALDEAELSLAVLTDLDLTGASLRSAYLDRAVLRRVDLTGADLSNAVDPGVTFDAVTFKNTTCPDGTLSDEHQDTCVGH